jgi:hypothetical protein
MLQAVSYKQLLAGFLFVVPVVMLSTLWHCDLKQRVRCVRCAQSGAAVLAELNNTIQSFCAITSVTRPGALQRLAAAQSHGLALSC